MGFVSCKDGRSANTGANPKAPETSPSSGVQNIKADTLISFSGDWVFNYGKKSLGTTFGGIGKDATAQGKQVFVGKQVTIALFDKRFADSNKAMMEKRGLKAGAVYIMEGEDFDTATFKYVRDVDMNLDTDVIAKQFGIDTSLKW